MALILVDGDGPACECDGCTAMIEGRGHMVDGFELCVECLAKSSCDYCGVLSTSLRIFEWNIPATWDTPCNNGSMNVCPSCFEKLSKRRSA